MTTGPDRPDGVSDDTQPDDNGDDSRRGDGGARERVAGNCTSGATSKLKAKPDDGRLEVEFEVDQNRNGVDMEGSLPPEWAARRQDAGDHDQGAERIVLGRAQDRQPRGQRPHRRTVRSAPSGQVCRAELTVWRALQQRTTDAAA